MEGRSEDRLKQVENKNRIGSPFLPDIVQESGFDRGSDRHRKNFSGDFRFTKVGSLGISADDCQHVGADKLQECTRQHRRKYREKDQRLLAYVNE